ncbi:ISKra4 family transposase [Chloroflexota bacterium]
MSFTTSIAQNARMTFEELFELVSGEASQNKTAHEIEEQLWWGVLTLGQQLLQTFFTTQEAVEEPGAVYEANGLSYPYRGQRQRTYISLFGKVTVRRAYYWRKGESCQYPLDEALSLPERCYSDWVQARLSELSMNMPYDDAVDLFAKWLRVMIPKGSLEQINDDHAVEVRAYYEGREAPETAADDTILVVSADGKGIPMTRQDSPPPEARRGKGKKKTAKKEATVTALHTIAPYERCADDIIQALVPDYSVEEPSLSARPTPTGKQLWGTLAGQQPAFEHLVTQVERRDSEQLAHRVALTDGNRGLQRRVQQDLPDFTLIVDVIHVTEYLWKAANVLLGETHPLRDLWVQDALRCLLTDQFDSLLNHLSYQLPGLSKRKQTDLKKVMNYLHNNRGYMNYQAYLAQGYPIGTGVIEGACRHLVKDRFERTGMHWSKSGAQVMLDLRATHLNGDWVSFQRFRRHQVHKQRYGSTHPDVVPEEVMLSVAA